MLIAIVIAGLLVTSMVAFGLGYSFGRQAGIAVEKWKHYSEDEKARWRRRFNNAGISDDDH
jgi:hypothetical protein